MKKIIAIVLAFSLFAVACGDDDAAAPTCEGVADGTITLLQDVIDLLASLDQETLGVVFAGGDLPAEFDALQATGDELGVQAEELGCDNLNDLIAERSDQLVVAPEDGLGQLIKSGAEEGDEDVLGRLFR